MLPSIDSEQGDIVSTDGILVGTGNNLQGASALVLDQPGPATALNASKGRVDLLPQGIEATKVFLDALLECAFGLATTTLVSRSQVLPEEAVVDVAAAVEVQQRRDRSGGRLISLGLGILDGLECAVEAVDIGLVVVLVVQLHDLAADIRFEGAIVVGQVG